MAPPMIPTCCICTRETNSALSPISELVESCCASARRDSLSDMILGSEDGSLSALTFRVRNTRQRRRNTPAWALGATWRMNPAPQICISRHQDEYFPFVLTVPFSQRPRVSVTRHPDLPFSKTDRDASRLRARLSSQRSNLRSSPSRRGVEPRRDHCCTSLRRLAA